MENDIMLCEACKFYDLKLPDREYHTKRNGLCRRYPRTPVVSSNGNMFMVMSETNLNDWCGEFVQK